MICNSIKSECARTDKTNKNALTTAHFDSCKRIPDQWDLLTITISVIASRTNNSFWRDSFLSAEGGDVCMNHCGPTMSISWNQMSILLCVVCCVIRWLIYRIKIDKTSGHNGSRPLCWVTQFKPSHTNTCITKVGITPSDMIPGARP